MQARAVIEHQASKIGARSPSGRIPASAGNTASVGLTASAIGGSSPRARGTQPGTNLVGSIFVRWLAHTEQRHLNSDPRATRVLHSHIECNLATSTYRTCAGESMGRNTTLSWTSVHGVCGITKVAKAPQLCRRCLVAGLEIPTPWLRIKNVGKARYAPDIRGLR